MPMKVASVVAVPSGGVSPGGVSPTGVSSGEVFPEEMPVEGLAADGALSRAEVVPTGKIIGGISFETILLGLKLKPDVVTTETEPNGANAAISVENRKDNVPDNDL